MNLLDPEVLSSPAAWADFAPGLHVCDRGFLASPARRVIGDAAAREAAARLGREGYCQLPPMTWDLPIETMADVVRHLADLDIPPVFAWHYDEFWLAFARCYPILVELLDDHPVMLPEFWAWHIDPLRQDSGWAPHRDKGWESLRDDGRPKIATLWLPLTDATTLNGCMYIVPSDRDPTYGTRQESQHRFSLADIRALPAEAGSVLGWDQAVLHWGSHAAARDEAPRISIACEFQRRDVPPFNAPLLDPLVPPDFVTRQVLIGRQMLRYQHMVHAGADWQARAEQMASAGPRVIRTSGSAPDTRHPGIGPA